MSQNRYSYVGNNPINYVDPTGHVGEKIKSFLKTAFKWIKTGKKAKDGVDSVKDKVETAQKSDKALRRRAVWNQSLINDAMNFAAVVANGGTTKGLKLLPVIVPCGYS